MIRWVYFIILINCFSSANAELTIEERNWLIKNWLSIDSITHVSGKNRVELAFPDLGTFVDLMDDETTYAEAYDNWKKRYCKMAGELYEKALYELSTNQPVYFCRKAELETAQRGK